MQNERHTVAVNYSDGDCIVTEINGTKAVIQEYFAVGNIFNIGIGPDDNLQSVTSLVFIS